MYGGAKYPRIFSRGYNILGGTKYPVTPGVGSYAVSDNGWIDQELFHYWMTDHFLTHAVASRPLWLLLDGHSSHFRPDTIQFAKDNDIVVFCLPPHTTHKC